jgi:hypothetical protein
LLHFTEVVVKYNNVRDVIKQTPVYVVTDAFDEHRGPLSIFEISSYVALVGPLTASVHCRWLAAGGRDEEGIGCYRLHRAACMGTKADALQMNHEEIN